MRLMVSTKLNPILLATIRFTVCGIPTNVYKKYGNLLFPQYISVFLKPVLTGVLQICFFPLLAYVSRMKTKITVTQTKTGCLHKTQLHNYYFWIILNRERRDSLDVQFKKPRHTIYVILFTFQTAHTGTQKSKEVLTSMQQQMFYQ